MQYNLSNILDKARFKTRVNALYEKGAIVDVTEKVYRSANQNRYLHAIIGLVAIETGVSVDYAKQEYYKRLVNPDIFECGTDKFTSKKILRSSASLNPEEMSKSIDRFKRWAAEQKIAIPEPGDTEMLLEIEYEISRQSKYF